MNIQCQDTYWEALVKYDRLLACRGLPHIVAQDRRQTNSLSYLIRAYLKLPHRRDGHSDILVSSAIIKQPSVCIAYHCRNEDYVRNLSVFLPLILYLE